MERLPKSCSQVPTIAGYLFLGIGLVVLAGCATGGNAKKEESQADFKQAIAMIREADYEKTIELMVEVTGAAPEASAVHGGNAEAALVSPSAQSEVSMPEAVPLGAKTSKQPAVVPQHAEGEK